MGAVDDEHRRMHALDSRDILEDIEPICGLHVADDTEAAFHRTVKDHTTDFRPGCKVYGWNATDGLAIADDLLIRDAAVMREVVIRGFHIGVKVCLRWNSRTFTVPAVLIGKHICLELGAEVPEVVEHNADVCAVTMAEEKCPRGVRSSEVEAEDDIAAASPHPHGVDSDALSRQVWERCEAIVCLDEEHLLFFRHMIAWWPWGEKGDLVDDSSHQARHQRQATDAADKGITAGNAAQHRAHALWAGSC